MGAGLGGGAVGAGVVVVGGGSGAVDRTFNGGREEITHICGFLGESGGMRRWLRRSWEGARKSDVGFMRGVNIYGGLKERGRGRME